MLAWRAKRLSVAGRPFWLAVEDYVGSCTASRKPAALALYALAEADGFSSYVTEASGSQQRLYCGATFRPRWRPG